MAFSMENSPELISEQVANLLVQPLEAASVMLSSGFRIIDTAGPLRIPTIASGFTASYVEELEPIPEASGDLGEISLLPSTLNGIKSYTVLSNELVRNSAVGVSQLLQQRLVHDVASKLDTELLSGTGTGETITGLLNQPGVTRGTFTSGDPDSVLVGLATAAGNDVNVDTVFLNSADFFGLQGAKTTDGQYLLSPDPTAPMRYSIFGVKVVVTNKVPVGTAVAVDSSMVVIARDQNPTVSVFTETEAKRDAVAIRATTRFDIGLLHPAGVTILSGA